MIQANQTYPLLEAIGRFPHNAGDLDLPRLDDLVQRTGRPAFDPASRRRSRVLATGSHPDLLIWRSGSRFCTTPSTSRLSDPRAPLPPRPKRALILAKHPSYLDAVRAACAATRIAVWTFLDRRSEKKSTTCLHAFVATTWSSRARGRRLKRRQLVARLSSLTVAALPVW